MMKRVLPLFCRGARMLDSRSPGITPKLEFLCSNPDPVFFIHSKQNTSYIPNKQEDQQLIQVLQSEIAYEQSNRGHYEEAEKSLVGPFVLAADPPASQDVVLRRSYDQEEIAVTALLRLDPEGTESGAGEDDDTEEIDDTEIYPRTVFFKVCITKPLVDSILQFDCRSQGYGNDFIIDRVSFHESLHSLRPSKYRGPPFSSLDYKLKDICKLPDAFKEFLEARGINIDLVNFLIIHLHNKEQRQYVQWLHCLESIIKKGFERG